MRSREGGGGGRSTRGGGEAYHPYAALVDAWLRELSTGELQPLPDSFWEDLESWFAELRSEVESGGPASGLAAEALDVCGEVARRLRHLRTLKRMAASVPTEAAAESRSESTSPRGGGEGLPAVSSPSGPPEGLGPTEGRPAPAMGGRVGVGEFALVTFKTAVPKFVGRDLNVYGPFREGDLALLPREDAETLSSGGAAEVVEEDEDTGED